MAKRKRINYDILQVFGRVPELTGFDLKLRAGIWQGRYYMDGRRHAYKRDKLKVKIWNSDIWLHEQGGESMSLAAWLVRFGGAADFKDAYRIIGSSDAFNPDFMRSWHSTESGKPVTEKYVEAHEYAPYKRFALWDCPLVRWMSGLFGYEAVENVWNLYGATTDERGLAVWWFIDPDGEICHDKRMRYHESGKRDKTFGGTRKFRTGDGYTARTLFGAHLQGSNLAETGIFLASDGVSGVEWRERMPNISNALRKQKTNIVESEKTALLATLAFGGLWLATGGKGNLCETDADMMLWPDVDAASDWSERGDVCEWWLDAESMGAEVGEKWDIGDFAAWLASKRFGADV